MDVYEILFQVTVFEDDEELEEGEPQQTEDIVGVFHVLASNLFDATEEAVIHLEGHMEMDYEIISVKKDLDIHIVNFDKDYDDGGMMMFKCAFCGEDVIMPSGEWDMEPCPACKKVIQRDRVIEIKKNHYMMISLKEDKK